MKLLFDAQGRIGRPEYGYGLGLLALLFAAAVVIAVAAPSGAIKFAALVMSFGACFWSYLCLSAKRLRDLDCSPAWTGLVFVPGVGLGVLTVILLALRGSDGPNQFGVRG